MKIFLSILFSIFITFISCINCKSVIKDVGEIPENINSLIPYADSQTFSLKHSEGQIINFTVERHTREEFFDCHKCCAVITKFRVCALRFFPDYPIFNMRAEISNLDSVRFDIYFSIGNAFFNLDINEEGQLNHEIIDSILIDSIWHYNIIGLKSETYSYNNEELHADSLFYNTEKGILKIIMSNAETYTLSE